MRWSGILVGVLLVMGTRAHAQERVAPRVLLEAAGTRALSLGDVHPVSSTDSDAIFYAAAFAERLRGAGIGGQWYDDGATLYTASAAIDWWSGALALGLRAFDYETDLDLIPDSILAVEAPVDVSERAASLAFSRRVKGVRGSVTAHLLEQRGAGERDVMFAADLSLGANVGPVTMALAGRNIGPTSVWHNRTIELPTLVMLSASTTSALTPGPFDVIPVASITYDIAGGVRPAGGVEVSYWPVSGRTFSLRAGAREVDGGSPLTFGAGFSGDRIVLDYAAAFDADDELIHRFGVRWR
jgi:hypothetical protein